MKRSRGLYEADWRIEQDSGQWTVWVGERLIGRVREEENGKFTATLNARNPHPFRNFADTYAAAWFLVRKFDR